VPFELEDLTRAKVASVNVRSERHGPDELVPAVDVRFQLETTNDILSAFDGHLKSALYFRSTTSTETQPSLEGLAQSDAPNLRFPKLAAPLRWDDERTGYTLTIDLGLGGRSNLILTGCKVAKFAIEPKEGGTVLLAFSVSSADDLSEKVLGKLAQLVQHDVLIELHGPTPEGEDLAGKKPAPPAETPKPKDATDAFLDANT
jgi:hypothetical protein